MKTDIEIAQECRLNNIEDVASTYIEESELYRYGKEVAKVPYDYHSDYPENGKLILVTAMTPTKSGEGKTTVSVGLIDAMNRLGYRTVGCLRQPSFGPVFGMKGGAAGGGYSQVVPMEKLNLGLTGDLDAITSANNLLAAMIDNHIFQGNELGIDVNRIVWKRCLDVCDRSLRSATIKIGKKSDNTSYEAHFDITAASEIMTIMVLSKNIDELKERLGNITVAYSRTGEPVYARQLKAEGAMTAILREAFNPNILQTLEHNPVFVHCGPFANISLGTNSIVCTKLGLRVSDYVVTEAGFASDLGAEKFFDIKCRVGNLNPACTVLVTTVKALRYHGGGEENIPSEDAVVSGLSNLRAHIDNLRSVFNQKVVVALNRFSDDTEEEILLIKYFCQLNKVPFAVSTAFLNGGEGATELAELIVNECNTPEQSLNYSYSNWESISDRIENVVRNVYHASDIEWDFSAHESLVSLYGGPETVTDHFVCIAKTQYSFSDDAKKLNDPRNYTIRIRDIEKKTGAGLTIVHCGNIVTMPGLPKVPNAEKIDYVSGKIVGLS